MENRSILIAFLVVWALSVPAIYVACKCMRIRLLLPTLSQIAPAIVALIMVRIFLIGHGATVRQLAAGPQDRMDLWSLWVGMWPILLITSTVAGLAHVYATFAVATQPGARRYLVVTIPGVLIAIFALFTVLGNFPDA